MTLAIDDYSRIYWHSRRGMLELDLILMPFAEKHYRTLSDADKQRYLDLLACEDQDLFAWLLGHRAPEDPALAHTVAMVLDKHFA